MDIINVVQGTPEWHAHRATYNNASETPAARNHSPHTSRNELIRMKKTGDAKLFNEWAQKNIIDKGHLFEKLARPLAQEIFGEPLFPVTGVNGNYSASFDGLDISETKGWEHKRMNNAIRACSSAEGLPIYYREQMETQLMVCEGEFILFMATDWKEAPGEAIEEGCVYGYAKNDQGIRTRYVLVEEKHFYYYPDLDLRQEIIDAWGQVDKDVENYVPEVPAAEVKPLSVVSFPVLSVRVMNAVAESNFPEIVQFSEQFLAELNMKPQTDQQFADAKDIAKKMRAFASAMDAEVEKITKTANIAAVISGLGSIAKRFNKSALELEKLVDAEVTNRKTAMVAAAEASFKSYVEELNTRLAKPLLPLFDVDFWLAIKGKSNVRNMQNDLDALLAESKIRADRTAALIAANLDYLREASGEEYPELFPDISALVQKDADSFCAIIKTRIADHCRRQVEASQNAIASSNCLSPNIAQGSVPAVQELPMASSTSVGSLPAGKSRSDVIELPRSPANRASKPGRADTEELFDEITRDMQSMSSEELRQMAHMRDRILAMRERADKAA